MHDASYATYQASGGADLAGWAEGLMADLRRVQRLLRQTFAADLARADLTASQVSLLSLLAAEDGQDLGSLSRRLHLAHSTVSGIVDRLARKGLVERRSDAQDRRISRVFLAEPVAAYTQRILPARQHRALLGVAGRSTPEERAAMRAGLTCLRRLLEVEVEGGGDGRGVSDGSGDHALEKGGNQ